MVSHNIAKEKEVKTMPSACQTMGTVLWNAEGCILVEFLP
jgi:hypothetical protein